MPTSFYYVSETVISELRQIPLDDGLRESVINDMYIAMWELVDPSFAREY